MIYVNTTLVQWFSKKQSAVEVSVFGSEFFAMKQGIDTFRGVRYKLKMMDFPILGPSLIYGDNVRYTWYIQSRDSFKKVKQLHLLSFSP